MSDDDLPPELGVTSPDDADTASSEDAASLDNAASADDTALADDTGLADDAHRRAVLRATADELRGETSESRQLAAILYRVSDLYDPDEDTSPEEIYLNVRNIMQVKARGGLRRE